MIIRSEERNAAGSVRALGRAVARLLQAPRPGSEEPSMLEIGADPVTFRPVESFAFSQCVCVLFERVPVLTDVERALERWTVAGKSKASEGDDGWAVSGTGLIVAGSALLFLAAARPLTDFFSRAGSPGLGAAFPVFVAVVAGTAFVFGVSYALITVPSMTLLQEELPDEISGRVFGFLNMLVSIFSLVPLVVVGPIADLWGVAPVFVGFATIVAIVWIGGKSTRDLRRQKAKLVSE